VCGRHATINQLLDQARDQLDRLSPSDAGAAARAGALLVDIRSDGQRARDGMPTGATLVQRNVLEWRLDPGSRHCDDELARRDRRVILICDEGYQSSLAAATLRRFGLDATDVIGGFQAWKAAGLPVDEPGVRLR
jgi:rhodanese-related sulfurtransferase